MDYRYYYVGMFSDHDMFLRYFGGGIGHLVHVRETEFTLDDAPFNSEWEDVDVDIPDMLESDELDGAMEVSSEADLLKLVPELITGGLDAIEQANRLAVEHGTKPDSHSEDDLDSRGGDLEVEDNVRESGDEDDDGSGDEHK
ncbi:hypothetical protein LXA43DRAFT_1102052 [Ganoderma leucocontextum]|nr:hypothetical protein LXA43DRAFT_1102052 [Ganoderma leucocontextum]